MPRPIEVVGTTTAGFVGLAPAGPVSQPVKLSQAADFAPVFGGFHATMPLGHSVQHFFDNGGKEAYVVRIDLDADGFIGSEADGSGMHALDKVDLFNVLVMPDSDVDIDTQSAAVAFCERRRAVMINDLPETVATVSAAESWIKSLPPGLRSSNAAFYFPRIRAPDSSMSGVVRTFPAAGAIAGLYARTDSTRGVWKAPAGNDAKLIGAAGLAIDLDAEESARLNPLGLNCLRTFPTYGTVCWGARTARGADTFADEFKYVPVRRLSLMIEESILRGTRWVESELNAEPLWVELRESIGAFMHSLFKKGAFTGRTAREAYFVKCDGSTTAQADIDAGKVNIQVGFAPLKPGEFIIIRIQQIVSDG